MTNLLAAEPGFRARQGSAFSSPAVGSTTTRHDQLLCVTEEFSLR
jgi:hypothetical protein